MRPWDAFYASLKRRIVVKELRPGVVLTVLALASDLGCSHWPVSDQATSRLMTEFMRRWRGGESRAQAWREAQLALLRDKSQSDFSNPYFWAAFTLTGQWR